MDDARDHAEAVALQALGWLAGRPDLMGVFLGSSGIDAGALRVAASEPETLAAVVDFLLMDDAWVLDFAADTGLPPEALARARAGLPGGDQVHWT